ncbi:hypothetical protein ABH926_000139 [Catenulispora sp. GP43]
MTKRAAGSSGRRASAFPQLVTVPCSTQRADHPVGTTCTTIRRRQCPQYRGGSSSARAAHRSWPVAAVGSPHCPQKSMQAR